MGTGAGRRPWRGVQAVLDGGFHQLVVGRMEFHQVNAVAKAVVRVEFGLELVGQCAQLQVVRRAGEGAKLGQTSLCALATFAPHGLDQCRVLRVHVVVAQLVGQVAHSVGVRQVQRSGSGFRAGVDVGMGVHVSLLFSKLFRPSAKGMGCQQGMQRTAAIWPGLLHQSGARSG